MRGFTLIEIAVVLVLIAGLAALLTPIATSYIEQARIAEAQAEVRAIGEAIQRFEKDVSRYPMFTSSATIGMPDTSADVVTLRGPGNVTNDGTAWTLNSPTDGDCVPGTCYFSAIASQLMLNSPSYPTTTSLGKPFKWKGPYIDAAADPWGSAYLVNIINAKAASTDAAFVLSAGPNGAVETAFNITASSAITPGGDDIIFRIK